MRTTRSGSENGRPRRKRSCIKLKMAVFIPMPSASVMTARVVNPGDLRSWRRAKRTSFISFSAQSLDWIYARGASSRKKTGKEGGSGQHRDCAKDAEEYRAESHNPKPNTLLQQIAERRDTKYWQIGINVPEHFT